MKNDFLSALESKAIEIEEAHFAQLEANEAIDVSI
jgi:hypothetical protein